VLKLVCVGVKKPSGKKIIFWNIENWKKLCLVWKCLLATKSIGFCSVDFTMDTFRVGQALLFVTNSPKRQNLFNFFWHECSM
jgi:hypothetical protein